MRGSPVPPGSKQKRASSLPTYTVQCALCFKWRKVPSLELYEEIRGEVSKHPFICEHTVSWPGSEPRTCTAPPDLVQDDSMLWALDREDIPQPPPGWRRSIAVRGGGSNKFSDVYYHPPPPSSKKLRSLNEVDKFLSEHPEFAQQGITLKCFSFIAPRAMPPDFSSASSSSGTPGLKRGTGATAAAEPPGKRPKEGEEETKVEGQGQEEGGREANGHGFGEVKGEGGAEGHEAAPSEAAGGLPDSASAAEPPAALAAPCPPAAPALPDEPSPPVPRDPLSSPLANGAPGSPEGGPLLNGTAKEEPS